MTVLTLNLSSLVEKISDLEEIRFTARDLELLARDNPDTRLETSSEGKLIFMFPTGGETGNRNLRLAFQIELWNSNSKLGKVFDSSTGFRLSNDAVRSPDVSWIPLAAWNSLTKQQKRRYLPIDPDFVIELLSPTDILSNTQNKMKEYIDCGVKLGWLINPDDKQVEIYRIDREKEVLNNPLTLSGENILSGLVVDLSEIFD